MKKTKVFVWGKQFYDLLRIVCGVDLALYPRKNTGWPGYEAKLRRACYLCHSCRRLRSQLGR